MHPLSPFTPKNRHLIQTWIGVWNPFTKPDFHRHGGHSSSHPKKKFLHLKDALKKTEAPDDACAATPTLWQWAPGISDGKVHFAVEWWSVGWIWYDLVIWAWCFHWLMFFECSPTKFWLETIQFANGNFPGKKHHLVSCWKYVIILIY